MKEAWVISILAALFSSAPADIKKDIEPREGGSQPIKTNVLPVIINDKQYVTVAFYYRDGPIFGKVPKIYPPFVLADIEYPNAAIHWKRISNIKNIGIFDTPITEQGIPYLGYFERGALFSVQERRDAEKRYNTLILDVLENRWLLTRHATTAEERATAQELQECTRILYDKPLLPYYRHVGKQFLAWMDRAAK